MFPEYNHHRCQNCGAARFGAIAVCVFALTGATPGAVVCAAVSMQAGGMVGTALQAGVKLNMPSGRTVHAVDVRAGTCFPGFCATVAYLRETPLPLSGMYWGVAAHLRGETATTTWGVGLLVGAELFLPVRREPATVRRAESVPAHTWVIECMPVWVLDPPGARIEASVGWRWGFGW